MQPPASNIPLSAITTDQIQKYLEDNKNLILAILECQNLGRYQECAQYQAVLQKNLMYLAAIADAQPPASQQQQPNPTQAMQTPPSSMPQTSSFMQQPGGGGGSSSSSGQNSLFQVNSRQVQEQHQQQMLQFQQQFRAQMGFRGGGQNGLFGMQSGGREGGSEVAYGGDGRGMFFDGGSGFRES